MTTSGPIRFRNLLETLRSLKPGDVWILNEHKVLCASALERNSYTTLMGKDRAEMVFIDPPYNVAIDGNVSGLGTTRHREFAMASGEMSKERIPAIFDERVLAVGEVQRSALSPLCVHGLEAYRRGDCGRRGHLQRTHKLLRMGSRIMRGWGPSIEASMSLFLCSNRKRVLHRNNVQLGQYGRNRTNVWNYPCANSFSRSGRGRQGLLALHPTVKPAALVGDAMMDCTERGAIVLDTFLGSGTTVIAAERTGRRCYGLEIDPRYVDTIVRRWQVFTRSVAIHSQTGRSFAEMEEEVASRCDSVTTKHRPSPIAITK